MPLYIEGDLRSRLAGRVKMHVDNCSRCCELAGEYEESQSWLRSTEPPKFDDAFFNELKRVVLTRVEVADARTSVLASLAAPWNRRQLLALAAAVSVMFGSAAFYLYQARMSGSSVISQQGAQTPTDESDKLRDGSASVGTEEALRASSKAPRRVRRVVSLRGQNFDHQQKIVGERMNSSPHPQVAERMNSSQREADSPADTEDNSRPMLRIEFQTSDPNIRIIWFAPCQTDSHQSKPATD